MKKIFSLVIITMICGAASAAAAKKKAYRKSAPEIPTVTEVANKIDSISASEKEMLFTADTLKSATSRTAAYMASLPSGFDRKALAAHYSLRMEAFSEAGDADSLLTVCRAAALTDMPDLLPMAYEGMAQVYASQGDTGKLTATIDAFSAFSATQAGDPWASTIGALREEYDDVLHPVPFIDKVRGTWVCYSRSLFNSGYPWLTFTINNLENNGITLDNIPGYMPGHGDKDLYRLYRSQFLGGTDGQIDAAFGSDKFNQGDAKFAESGFEATRKFRADMRGNIAASNASFGNRLAYSAATEITASLLDALFSSSANSTKKVAALNLRLDMNSPKTFTSQVEYYNYEVNVNNMNYTPRPVFSGNAGFVKWEASDSIYFVDSKMEIHGQGPVSAEYLAKYNAIKEKYSWKRAKYLLPLIGTEIACAGLLTGGIIMMTDCVEKDEFGHDIYDSDGARKIKTGKLTGGVIVAALGYVGAIITPFIISGNRTSHRSIALDELNKENMKKLQKKATLSLAPTFEPRDMALGLGAKINF